MGPEMELFFAIVSIVCGGYCIYGFYQAKTKGVIVESLYLDKDTAQKTCNDKKEYIKVISMPSLVLGIGLLLYGGLTLYHGFVSPCYWIMQGSLLVILGILVWFGVITTKAKRKYFN